MNKEKIMVYPYDGQFSPILRHQELLTDSDISALVSPRGWALDGKDAGNADNGSNIGINVTSDFDGALELCDTVLINESKKVLDFEKSIMPKVIRSIESGKNIICAVSLEDESFKAIQQQCEARDVYFKYFNYPKVHKVHDMPEKGKFLYDINTPVIFVLGAGEQTNKFEIQLSLRENIIKMGYKLSQIGTRGYCELLGFHSIPDFMLCDEVSEADRIILFNHYVKGLEQKERPDVIIIGVPGSIMPLNNKITNGFGILAYGMCQAVTPDSSIFSYYYEDYNEEYFSELADTFKFRFGCQLDCFNLANIKIDWQGSRLEDKMDYISLDSEFVDERKKKYRSVKTPVLNVLNNDDAKNMADYIINKLCEYGQAECI